jgi:hypothetical protein
MNVMSPYAGSASRRASPNHVGSDRPSAFTSRIREADASETEKWAKVIKFAGIKPE